MTESEGDNMESQDIEMKTVNNDELKPSQYAMDTYDDFSQHNDGGINAHDDTDNNDHEMNSHHEGDDGLKGHDASDSGAISTGDDSQNDDCDITPHTDTFAHNDTSSQNVNNGHDDDDALMAKNYESPPVAPSDDNPENVHVIDDDLEEGECSDDEEEASAPPDPEPPKEAVIPRDERKEKSSKEKKHKHRDRSRDRHKSKKHRNRERHESQDQQEGEQDEEGKKRSLLSKLKALEGEMGILDDYGEDEMSGVYAEGESPRVSSEEEARSSRSRSSSPAEKSKKKRKRNDRTRERKRRRHEERRKNERIEGKDEICGLFMQGKCPKATSDCLYSHDAEPPQVWELCKFYLFDRCAKKEKCLYLHKGFPCKYFHTGKRCLDTKESCKFSHEDLNDMTRALLLKHIESAPKEILGDFPRMSREVAAAAIFNTEAKHKGWITEGPNAVPPPVLDPNPYDSPPRQDEEDSDLQRQENSPRQDFQQPAFQEPVKPPVMPAMPNHIKLNALQEKLLAQSYGNATGSTNQEPLPQLGQKLSRWEEQEQKPSQGFGYSNPPLAVQQAMALSGGRGAPMGGYRRGVSVRPNTSFLGCFL